MWTAREKFQKEIEPRSSLRFSIWSGRLFHSNDLTHDEEEFSQARPVRGEDFSQDPGIEDEFSQATHFDDEVFWAGK